MGTAKQLKFDTTFKNEVRVDLGLKNDDYLVALFIQEQMLNQESAIQGWCYASKEQIAQYLGLSRRTITTILKKLHDKGLIEKFAATRFIKTTQKFYLSQNGIPSAQPAHTAQILRTPSFSLPPITPNTLITPKHSLPSEETDTVGRCPLKTILKDKYPEGHKECVEYITSFKFVNKAKQFRFLHQMLRAGLDFPDIDKLVNRLEKKPYFQENGYDFATVAGEADRRSNAI